MTRWVTTHPERQQLAGHSAVSPSLTRADSAQRSEGQVPSVSRSVESAGRPARSEAANWSQSTSQSSTRQVLMTTAQSAVQCMGVSSDPCNTTSPASAIRLVTESTTEPVESASGQSSTHRIVLHPTENRADIQRALAVAKIRRKLRYYQFVVTQ